MEDFIKKYQKKKRKNTLAIIATSFALAVGINFYFQNSQIGQSLKSSVLDSSVQAQSQSDLVMERTNNLFTIKASKTMSQVQSLSFAIAYNNLNLEIKEKILGLDAAELSDLSNNPGYNTYLIHFSSPRDIKAGEDIIKMVIEKKSESLEKINIVQANFLDSKEEMYGLTTSSIEY